MTTRRRISAVEVIRLRGPESEEQPWWCTTPTDLFHGSRIRGDETVIFRGPPGVDAAAAVNADAADTGGVVDAAAVIVRLRTDDGLDGLGYVALGGNATAEIVERRLAPLVMGRDPFDVELLWGLMFRSTINIGRKGLVLEAISGVDIALWDLMGKATGQPVYNLLGGRTRDRIRTYVSRTYARVDVAAVAAEVRELLADGYTALKMRFGYGPADGLPGMRRNQQLVATVREVVGPDFDLMADAYMGWDATYAIRMIDMLEEFNLGWVEEPVPPDDIEGYARIRARVKTPISGGEHEFTRWEFKELLGHGAVDIVQLDVNRVGGITEARKIWAMAAAHDLPVIPHGGNFHNVHLVMAHLNSPLLEMFPRAPLDGNTLISHVLVGDPQAVDGYVTLPETPGLGVTLDEDLIAKLRIDRAG